MVKSAGFVLLLLAQEQVPIYKGETLNTSIKLLAYREVDWTAEIDAAIGTDSDTVIGHRFGISPRSITARRRKLGLHVEQKTAPRWTRAMEKRLGKMPDTQVAKKLGIDAYWVRKRRAELQIAAHKPADLPSPKEDTREKLKLTEDRIALLGKHSDVFLAMRWGCTAGTVTRHRQRLGVPPFRENDDIQWSSAMLKRLGRVPDGTIAREFEVSPVSVKIKRIQLGILPYNKSEMDPEPPLPKRLLRQLGFVPDKQLADQFGVSRSHVRIARALRGIPVADYVPPTEHTWTKGQLKLLGTMSDGNVARRIGIPQAQVMCKRRSLEIPAFDRKAKIRWTSKRLAQLGKEPDHLLARQWSVPQRAVRSKREELQIKPCPKTTRRWTPEQIKILGTCFDTEVARKLGISASQVAQKRKALGIAPFRSSAPFEWPETALDQLGKIPDEDLALELGVSYQFVAAKRLELGIKACRRSSMKWTPEIIALMGVISDGQIAKKINCSTQLVRLKRIELGIGAYRPS